MALWRPGNVSFSSRSMEGSFSYRDTGGAQACGTVMHLPEGVTPMSPLMEVRDVATGPPPEVPVHLCSRPRTDLRLSVYTPLVWTFPIS